MWIPRPIYEAMPYVRLAAARAGRPRVSYLELAHGLLFGGGGVLITPGGAVDEAPRLPLDTV